ncbi:hypothetical protein C1H46_019910 [Malus baccata]|uniref:Uncharacterized protein n=1 Tax=Malus baccata TaxID=106549 RepID=A0A540M7M6_MALBA|nr:hypothetical protein C1H46_019910 [Malus baccata]
MADMKKALVQGSAAATLNNDRGDFRRFLCTLRYLGLTEISNAQGLDHLPSAHTWENYVCAKIWWKELMYLNFILIICD